MNLAPVIRGLVGFRRPISSLQREAMASHGIDLKTDPAFGAYPLPTDDLADSCLHELIEAQVERSPESVAFLFEQQSITYREMNARAYKVAPHLRALGVQHDVA